MKVLSLVPLLALALTAAHAAPCTVKEAEGWSSIPELLAAQARCYNIKSNSNSNDSNSPATDAENKLTCENNKDCILALTAAIPAMPDCTIEGVNLRDDFKKRQLDLVTRCEKLGVKVSGAASVGASATVVATAFAVVASMYA